MTPDEIRAFQENIDTLMASLECLRLVSVAYQAMEMHEEVYPVAEKILGCTIEASTNMREQVRQERSKLPYKLP